MGISLKSRDKHNISGAHLEEELRVWEREFKYVLFGMCTGMMESFYILALSNSNVIEESDIRTQVQLVEKACAESDVSSTHGNE